MLQRNDLACQSPADGEVALRFLSFVPTSESPWLVPAYRFDILPTGARCGILSLRIGDTERIRCFAGLLGFAIDAPCRGLRLAERAARLVLPLARAHGISPIWISANPVNAASIRTIERLGAVYVETVDLPQDYDAYADGERHKRRYRLAV